MLFVTFSEFWSVALQVSESLQRALLSSDTRTRRSILRRSARLPNIKGGNQQRSHSKILTEILITIPYYCNIGTHLLLFFSFLSFSSAKHPTCEREPPYLSRQAALKSIWEAEKSAGFIIHEHKVFWDISRNKILLLAVFKLMQHLHAKTSWYYAVLIASWPNIPGVRPASGAGAVSKPACCSEPGVSRSTQRSQTHYSSLTNNRSDRYRLRSFTWDKDSLFNL